MTRRTKAQHLFVKHVPERLKEGILYVSMEYATVVHSCLCGCGNEVVTPLSPTDWQLGFDGASVSLRPSSVVGASLANRTIGSSPTGCAGHPNCRGVRSKPSAVPTSQTCKSANRRRAWERGRAGRLQQVEPGPSKELVDVLPERQ